MKEYEKEKIELEIKELKRNWFKRTDNLKLLLTAIFLVITGYVTYKTGILDSRSENLRLERNHLKIEIAEFKKEKDVIEYKINLLKDSLLNIRRVNKKIQKRLTESTSSEEKLKIEKLRAENKTEEIIIFYKSKLDSLKMTIIKSKELQNVWTDQDGNKLTDQDGNYWTDENGEFITDEDGNYITIDGKIVTVKGERIKGKIRK